MRKDEHSLFYGIDRITVLTYTLLVFMGWLNIYAAVYNEEHQNIFEPFRQVNNSITRENRGSGLGLTITKQLIELMDGQITLESQLDQGSTFTVLLPIKNAPGE